MNILLHPPIYFSGSDSRAADSDGWLQIIGICGTSGWDLPERDHAGDVSNLTRIQKSTRPIRPPAPPQCDKD